MSQSKYYHLGVLWLDALLSIIPSLLIIFYLLNVSVIITEKTSNTINEQILFDKLTSLSDYIVKQQLSKKTDNAQWPNLVETLFVSAVEKEELRVASGLNTLSIGSTSISGKTCVYRLVVVETQLGKTIEKIYICGS